MKKHTLDEVKAAQPEWFSPRNKKFFGDISYTTRLGKKSGKTFLIRKTTAWTDMFGNVKTNHYVINPIGDDLRIQPLVQKKPPFYTHRFRDMEDVMDWLKEN